LQDADAADVTQEVLRSVARAAKDLDYDPKGGSFRGWLRTVVRNKVNTFLGHRKLSGQGSGGTDVYFLLRAQPALDADRGDPWDPTVLLGRGALPRHFSGFDLASLLADGRGGQERQASNTGIRHERGRRLPWPAGG